MMFDYDLLQETYDLDINVSTGAVYGSPLPEMPPVPDDPKLEMGSGSEDLPY